MKRLRITGLTVVSTLVVMLALAGVASAHVTVAAPGATRGGSDQDITFQVPNEKAVDTVGLTIALPRDTPLAGVLVQPLPGWTHKETTTRLAKPITTDDGTITSAVSQITWTAAAGAGVKPGEFGAFTVIAGSVPDTATLVFKAIQSYRDGSVVRWIEEAAPGSTVEPGSPAPELALPAASGGGTPAASTPATASATNGGSSPATVLAVVALVLAAGAVGLAVVTRAQSRRTS